MIPTIVIVPGFWVGPEPFSQLVQQLESTGLKVEIAQLPSTGTTSPGNPTMKDDIAAIRQHLESVLERGDDVVLVLHSAGAFLGGAAACGLTKKERGTQPGVTHAVFISGAVFPADHEHQPPPFTVIENSSLLCTSPAHFLFNDLTPSDQQKWVSKLTSQPSRGWDDKIPSAPWANVPSTYVICEKDNALPAVLQEQLAQMAGSELVRVDAGHMPMLSKSEELLSIIRGVL